MHVPGWHEAVRDLHESGEIQVVGIIEEQHPDRCRLFMQWKRMDWPILVDSLDLLETSAVPMTIAIDEYGIVRRKGLRLSEVEDFRAFLAEAFEEPADFQAAAVPAEWPETEPPGEDASVEAWRAHANGLILAGEATRLEEAVAAYERAVEIEPGDGPTHFRLGVALRKRHDSELRRAGDFQRAVDHWKAALDIDPNQYIWRRRIQQYGPRLDKPYPFYDWVPTARTEIESGGETPFPLTVEPGGAEFAAPLDELSRTPEGREEPDPKGRIHRDPGELIAVEAIAVPPVIEPGEAARVHFEFRPRQDVLAHWNNEAGEMQVWVDAPEGCRTDVSLYSVANPPEEVSLETRRVEFELECGESTPPGEILLSGYSLYYVCEDRDGTCLYRRQDIEVPLTIRAAR